eukprot:9216141-Alexandrium_andersonii.AAC.1
MATLPPLGYQRAESAGFGKHPAEIPEHGLQYLALVAQQSKQWGPGDRSDAVRARPRRAGKVTQDM